VHNLTLSQNEGGRYKRGGDLILSRGGEFPSEGSFFRRKPRPGAILFYQGVTFSGGRCYFMTPALVCNEATYIEQAGRFINISVVKHAVKRDAAVHSGCHASRQAGT